MIKHDAGENARAFDLDREAWVMLMAFPEDLKNSAMIAKAVSGFGIMVDWHEMENVARVVVKVYLNDDAKIPSSVKVNAGLPQKGRSWTCACYVLKRQGVPELMDEEAYVTVGPLHPLPPQPPRWMGPMPPAATSTPRAGSNGNNLNMDGVEGGQNVVADSVSDPERTVTQLPIIEGLVDLEQNRWSEHVAPDTPAHLASQNVLLPGSGAVARALDLIGSSSSVAGTCNHPEVNCHKPPDSQGTNGHCDPFSSQGASNKTQFLSICCSF